MKLLVIGMGKFSVPQLRARLMILAVATFALLILVAGSPPAEAAAPNPIQMENDLSGTPNWTLTNPATNREIEGYASLTSVERGSDIDLLVNTSAATYSLEVFRTGWYDGDGARLVFGPVTVSGTNQGAPPSPDAVTGIVEANWTNSYTLSTGSDWTTGVYLARLTNGSDGKQSYIIFVVRDDDRAADLLLQLPMTTYQAYNFWGGKSAYDFGSGAPPWGTQGGTHATKLSFDRPYAASTNPDAAHGMGAGEYLTNVQPVNEFYPISSDGWDYNTVRFLEREGYDVTYTTNLDSHVASLGDLTRHGAILSIGHDEYWSWEMRDIFDDAIADGTSVAFLGANIAYWQVRFEPNSDSGAPLRTMVIYKEYVEDPYWTDGDPTNNHLITVRFRDFPVDRSEEAMIGVRYVKDPFDSDIEIADASHWAFTGTGLNNGDKLVGLLGYEIDAMAAETPANIEVLGKSTAQVIEDTPILTSHMTMYQAPSGAKVFATGTMQWSWGLDDYNAPALRPRRLSPAAQQTTRNILTRFVDESAPLFPSAAADGPYGVGLGQTIVISPGVLENDTGPTAPGLQATLVSGPSSASSFTLNPDGSFSYTHNGSGTTSDSFTYMATSGGSESNEAIVTIKVEAAGNSPVALNDGPYGVADGGSLAKVAPGVLHNDSDPLGEGLTAVLTSGPSNSSSFNLSADGSFSYAHDGSASATDSFTYRVRDGAGKLSNTATVSFRIGTGAHVTGLVDTSQGKWYLYDDTGKMTSTFFYGTPDDVPFMGDWDGDGVETPGLYRQSDGFVYLRNSNTVGIADIRFFFGNPGDWPIAGDFNGDGFDTVSIYRASNQTFYIVNALGQNGGGLGPADVSYVFGNPGDQPFVGDFDGDGIETAGLHRATTGLVYYRNSNSTGNADNQFIFGDPGDRFVAGDWTGDGIFTPALFRPSNTTMYFRYTNSQGVADNQYRPSPSNAAWIPVAGRTQ